MQAAGFREEPLRRVRAAMHEEGLTLQKESLSLQKQSFDYPDGAENSESLDLHCAHATLRLHVGLMGSHGLVLRCSGLPLECLFGAACSSLTFLSAYH